MSLSSSAWTSGLLEALPDSTKRGVLCFPKTSATANSSNKMELIGPKGSSVNEFAQQPDSSMVAAASSTKEETRLVGDHNKDAPKSPSTAGTGNKRARSEGSSDSSRKLLKDVNGDPAKLEWRQGVDEYTCAFEAVCCAVKKKYGSKQAKKLKKLLENLEKALDNEPANQELLAPGENKRSKLLRNVTRRNFYGKFRDMIGHGCKLATTELSTVAFDPYDTTFNQFITLVIYQGKSRPRLIVCYQGKMFDAAEPCGLEINQENLEKHLWIPMGRTPQIKKAFRYWKEKEKKSCEEKYGKNVVCGKNLGH